jgi:hypothetical protein
MTGGTFADNVARDATTRRATDYLPAPAACQTACRASPHSHLRFTAAQLRHVS